MSAPEATAECVNGCGPISPWQGDLWADLATGDVLCGPDPDDDSPSHQPRTS